MSTKIDPATLLGARYGRLVIKSLYRKVYGGSNELFAICSCDCGNSKDIWVHSLKKKRTESCGCLHKEKTSNANRKHGYSSHHLWGVFGGMKYRCYQKRSFEYKYYGGRGIYICDDWMKEDGFECFVKWADQSGYRKGLQIDRIDNNGPYSPENCRWVNSKTNNRNKRSNVVLEYNGQSMCASDWSDIVGIPLATILRRVKEGWSYHDILSTPPSNINGIRKNSRVLFANGEYKSIAQWSRETGINYNTIWMRIKKYGWNDERALGFVGEDNKGDDLAYKKRSNREFLQSEEVDAAIEQSWDMAHRGRE